MPTQLITVTKRAVAYVRRSTDRQEQSIADQRAAIEAYAVERGFELLRYYVDDAISGSTAAQAIADGIINDLIERGERTVPVDFLEQWQGCIALYRGDRSPIYATDAGNVDDVAERVLALIVAGKMLGDPPLPT
jgi:hypothetical protein